MDSIAKPRAIGLALSLFIALLIPIYWVNEPSRQAAATVDQRQGAINRGAEVFLSTCVSCHGMRGQGGIGPALRNTRLDAKALEKTISRGVPATIMPAWSVEEGGALKKRQIEDLIIFLVNWDDHALTRAEEHQLGSLTTASGAASPEQAGPSEGNVARGAALFRTIGCNVCHGSQAEGGAVGPRLNGRGLTLAQVLSQVRKPFGGMPSYTESELSDTDVKDVHAFLSGQR